MPSAVVGPHPFSASGMLLVEESVLARLHAFRQDAPHKLEAGGILLGYRRGAHVHVSDATVPSSQDTRARTRFHRAAQHHQAVALAQWRASEGLLDYVGEWHTHPEAMPQPSPIDLTQWRIIHGLTHRQPMVFIIVGNHDVDWYGAGHRGRLVEIPMHAEA